MTNTTKEVLQCLYQDYKVATNKRDWKEANELKRMALGIIKELERMTNSEVKFVIDIEYRTGEKQSKELDYISAYNEYDGLVVSVGRYYTHESVTLTMITTKGETVEIEVLETKRSTFK